MKKTGLIWTIMLLFVNTILFSQEQRDGKEKIVVDQVVAVVGKNIIKLSDIENGYMQIRLQKGYENAFESRCVLLEDYLINKLMLHQANIDSVVIDEERLDEELDQRMKNMIRYYGSKENLEKDANKTIGELKETYRESLRESLMQQQIEYKIVGNVKITPKEVTEFFSKISKDSVETIAAEYEVLQIVKNPEVSYEERERVRESLNKLRERIIQGENFSTMAALYSEDPGSARKGGELGLFTRGDMVSEFEATSFTLQPGEVSPVIETKYGFHIIQLIERRGDFINVRHILMIPKVSPLDLQQAKYFLDSISILIKNEQYTFEDAAVLFSDDQSKTSGGLITNPVDGSSRMSLEITKEYLKHNFDKMKKGEITPPLLMKNDMNQDAYRIMFLKTKIDEHKANLVDDYNKIYEAALRDAQNQKIMKWAEKAIGQTYIKILDDYKNCEFKLNWVKK